MSPMECLVTSPDKQFFKGAARVVVVPAIDGALGILPRHAPLVALLGVGELRVTPEASPGGGGAAPVRFFVEGGLVRVLRNQVSVLATKIEPLEGLTRQAADRAVAALVAKRPARWAPLEVRESHEARLQVARKRAHLASPR
jgi:F-type H+-transporting ATPase subunit epsilon